jgi:hypothetical protein
MVPPRQSLANPGRQSEHNLERILAVKKSLVAAALVTAINGPAFAALVYVVQDNTTKACRVSHIPPDPKTHKLVGVTAYMTKAAAKAAKLGAEECKNSIPRH